MDQRRGGVGLVVLTEDGVEEKGVLWESQSLGHEERVAWKEGCDLHSDGREFVHGRVMDACVRGSQREAASRGTSVLGQRGKCPGIP